MKQSSKQNPPPHYLLTALGIRPYSTTYTLNGETATANYSPVALLQLLKPENRPDTVLCLLTDKALEKVWDDFSLVKRVTAKFPCTFCW